MNRIDRNKILVRHIVSSGLATSQKDLGLKLGYSSESAFSQVINEKVDYPKDFIERLQRIIPALNVDWLLTGSGDMLSSQPTIVAEPISAYSSDSRRDKSAAEMQGEIIPILPNEYVTLPEFNIRDYVQSNGRELEHIDPRNLVASAQLCFRVLKPSMANALLPGDRIFIRFLPKDAELTSGDIYFIDTPARGGMIRKVEVMGDEIRLIALHPDYADIVLHRESEVYSAAVIVGVFREFLSDSQFDINAIYKRKDEQIERVLNLQGELVAEIREQSKRNNALVDMIINKD